MDPLSACFSIFKIALAVSFTIFSSVVCCYVGLLFFRRLFGREHEELGVAFFALVGFMFLFFEFAHHIENNGDPVLFMVCTVVLARAMLGTALVYGTLMGSLYLTGIFKTTSEDKNPRGGFEKRAVRKD